MANPYNSYKEYTAEALREMAGQSSKRAYDSFARSDTDGFLSQAASQAMSSAYLAMANLKEVGCQHRHFVLVDLSGQHGGIEGQQTFEHGTVGRRVDAKLVSGKYGSCWRLSDEEAALYNRRFVPFSGWSKDGNGAYTVIGKQGRIQKQLGLQEDQEFAPTWVRPAGQYGMHIQYYRTDGK